MLGLSLVLTLLSNNQLYNQNLIKSRYQSSLIPSSFTFHFAFGQITGAALFDSSRSLFSL